MYRKPFLWVAAVLFIAAIPCTFIGLYKNIGGSSSSPVQSSVASGEYTYSKEGPTPGASLLQPEPVSTQGYQSIKESSVKPEDSCVSEGTSPGNRAINFTLTDLNGKRVSLADFKGKNVYLNFFTSWCSACRDEIVCIEKLYCEYKDRNLVVLGINLGEGVEDMKSFASKNGCTYDILLDSDFSISQKYNITTMPASYFINKEGIIVKSNVGGLDKNTMKQYIEALYN